MLSTPTMHEETDDAQVDELARDLEAGEEERDDEEEDDDDNDLVALDADDLMYMDGPDA